MLTPPPQRHRFLIIADGQFGPLTSKTANSCIRYFPERIVAVFDRAQGGKTVEDVLGFGGRIPVVGDFAQGLALGATAVLVGIAPAGGQLPPEWRGWLRAAIERGLELWSGLHTFIGDDAELGALARARGVRILDVRKPPADLPIADGRAAEVDAAVILTVGSDCNVGKMTAQLELRDELLRRGHRARFVATGQTGIFIEGWGIAVDAVVADFVAAAPVRPTKVIGICLNTFDLSEAAARAAVERAARDTALPATDPVRFGAAPLVEAIVRRTSAGKRGSVGTRA